MKTCARTLALVSLLFGFACKNKKKSEIETPAPTAVALQEDAAAPSAQTEAKTAEDAAESAAGHRVYLIKGGKLIEVATDGSEKEVAPFDPETSWCRVDARSKVVWSLGSQGVQAVELSEASSHKIVAPSESLMALEIRFPKGPAIGNADGLVENVALIIEVADTPSSKGEVICHGDRAYYCYDNMDSEDKSKWVLGQEAKDALALHQKFELIDTDFLKGLAARSGERETPAWTKIEAPSKPELTISKENCHADPDSCGELSYVGGGRFWSVITENDRGDFYYESSQLYDASKKEFVDFAKGLRSKTPLKESNGVDLVPSPDGDFAVSYGGKLVDLKKAEVIKELGDISVCGWR